MKYEDALTMTKSLKGKLFIDRRTLGFIEEHTKQGKWRTKPVTKKDLKPIIKP